MYHRRPAKIRHFEEFSALSGQPDDRFIEPEMLFSTQRRHVDAPHVQWTGHEVLLNRPDSSTATFASVRVAGAMLRYGSCVRGSRA